MSYRTLRAVRDLLGDSLPRDYFSAHTDTPEEAGALYNAHLANVAIDRDTRRDSDAGGSP